MTVISSLRFGRNRGEEVAVPQGHGRAASASASWFRLAPAPACGPVATRPPRDRLAACYAGSILQRAVWSDLQAIPSGETRSYGAIARTLPLVATAQEVGAACAANTIAVTIPCHRVVKADGSISGYRWGVERKRRLINLEGVA
ncbi:MAG: methylated-DNA--[protein]-cysteine S-methyltransferase [Phenylobacterium sp.]|uniref:methylated-DNA--[protein]-cysteine S-methyltransferase n=1 Tax=Phenylobacterium sp. TaxID=1871053 RepID=UPI002733ABDA|nr:methylated-DNA--[protein]-cysteine S-methyltransferase [Phenylobacterium sp.]MDP3172994.1 methylated-DNA--[protein]-cysteine S-methyltransferase [Phenylobacterium sp.]